MNNEELINALKIIHDACDAQIHCDDCPFGGKDGTCKILYCQPANWNINDDTDVWRALK